MSTSKLVFSLALFVVCTIAIRILPIWGVQMVAHALAISTIILILVSANLTEKLKKESVYREFLTVFSLFSVLEEMVERKLRAIAAEIEFQSFRSITLQQQGLEGLGVPLSHNSDDIEAVSDWIRDDANRRIKNEMEAFYDYYDLAKDFSERMYFTRSLVREKRSWKAYLLNQQQNT